MTKNFAIFDCDGTLVDSQANICLAMEHAFDEAELIVPSRSEIRRIVGLSLLEIMRELLPASDDRVHADMVENYRASYLTLRNNGLEHEPLYDGIVEVLNQLHQNEWILGVATGKSDRGLERCLDHHSIKDLFVTLQTADRHPSKPHPSMIIQAMADAGCDASSTVMIGDTVFDMDMGKSAGCRTIGVGWGYHSIDELHEAGADVIVESVAELTQYLGEMT